VENAALPAATLEDALDKLTIITQQTLNRVGGGDYGAGARDFLGGSTTVDGVWGADAQRITNGAAATAVGDFVILSQLQAAEISGGNLPTAGADGDILYSSGGTWTVDTLTNAIGANIVDIAAMAQTANNFIMADGGNMTLVTPANARTGLGLGAAALKATGTASGEVPLVGTTSATAALAGLVELATAAEVLTGTDTGRVPAVSTMVAHQGIAKAWVSYNQSTPAIADSYNVDSVTDTGTGNFTVVFTTDFANALYSAVGMAREGNDGGDLAYVSPYLSDTKAVGSMQFHTYHGGLFDSTEVNIAFFGDQ